MALMDDFSKALSGMKVEPRMTTKSSSFMPTPANMENFIFNGGFSGNGAYEKSLVVALAVQYIATKVADMPIRLVDRNGNEVSDAVGDTILGRPNETMSKSEFFEVNAMHHVLHGNSYNLVTGTTKRPGGIIPLYADGINVIPDNYASPFRVIRYEDLSRGKKYLPEEIVHIKSMYHKDYTLGLPWLHAAAQELQRSEQAGNYSRNIVKNGSFPSMSFVTDLKLAADQRDQLQDTIKRRYSGSENAGTPIVLDGGFKPYPLVFSPKDMEILAEERFTISLLLAVFRISPILVGNIQESKNQHTYQEAVRQFLTDCAIPVTNRILDKFNWYFYPNKEKRFIIETSAIEALRPTSADLSTAWWQTGNQKRQSQGLPLSDDPLMDQFLVPSNLVPIEQIGMGNAGEL